MTSFSHRPFRNLAAAMAVGALVVSGVCANPAQADDAPPSGYPSWSDVQMAKGNAAATQAEIGKINGLLNGLEAQANDLGTAAVQAGASYAVTQRQLDAVSVQVGVLTAQSGNAAKEGAKFRQEAVAVAVQSYKSGGAAMGIIGTLSALNSPQSLEGLDTLALVGAQAAAKQAKSQEAQAVASSLAKSLQVAETERAALAAQAKVSLDAAVAAQAAVTAQLEAKRTQGTTLVAQLASLNNTTAAVEQKYRQGQEALAAYNAAQEAKRQAAAQAAAQQAAAQEAANQQAARDQAAANQPAPNPVVPANPGGYIPVEVLLPNIPGGAVNDPAGARAYASSRLGAYGWNQSQFGCLVNLWNRESDWLTNATNPTSGAYGIAQSLPPGKYASSGSDWLTNYRTQIDWGLGYIQDRYGSPCVAWDHEVSAGWY